MTQDERNRGHGFNHRQLADLASWLRASRSGSYEDMIAKGRMTFDEAFADRHARDALDAEWKAIAADEPLPDDTPRCPVSWKVRTLEHALAGAEARAAALPHGSEDRRDWVDLSDAIAALIWHQSAPYPGLLAAQRINRHIRMERAS